MLPTSNDSGSSRTPDLTASTPGTGRPAGPGRPPGVRCRHRVSLCSTQPARLKRVMRGFPNARVPYAAGMHRVLSLSFDRSSRPGKPGAFDFQPGEECQESTGSPGDSSLNECHYGGGRWLYMWWNRLVVLATNR